MTIMQNARVQKYYTIVLVYVKSMS